MMWSKNKLTMPAFDVHCPYVRHMYDQWLMNPVNFVFKAACQQTAATYFSISFFFCSHVQSDYHCVNRVALMLNTQAVCTENLALKNDNKEGGFWLKKSRFIGLKPAFSVSLSSILCLFMLDSRPHSVPWAPLSSVKTTHMTLSIAVWAEETQTAVSPARMQSYSCCLFQICLCYFRKRDHVFVQVLVEAGFSAVLGNHFLFIDFDA